jgi:hypothetical protein
MYFLSYNISKSKSAAALNEKMWEKESKSFWSTEHAGKVTHDFLGLARFLPFLVLSDLIWSVTRI